MDADAYATRLLGSARGNAIAALTSGGTREVKADADGYRQLASAVRVEVLRQAGHGLWAPLGAADALDLGGLVVTARRGNGLTEAPIVLGFDFKNTTCRLLTVWSDTGAPA